MLGETFRKLCELYPEEKDETMLAMKITMVLTIIMTTMFLMTMGRVALITLMKIATEITTMINGTDEGVDNGDNNYDDDENG